MSNSRLKRRPHKLNWDDFRFFLALAQQHTLSGAARVLDVTHATMSRRIQHLEADIGATLFDQGPDGFHLTDKGRQIYDEVSLMNDQVANIQTITENDEPEGLVRISATPLFCNDIVSNCLPEFISKFPHIEVEVIADSRNVSLARQEAHLSLRLGRPESGEFTIRRVAVMQYQLYRGRAAYSEQVAEPIVCYSDEFNVLPEMQWLADHFGDRRVSMRSNMLSCQKRAIEQGVGIGLLPVYAAVGSEDLEPIDVDIKLPTREVWLVMRRTLSDVPRVRLLADFLAENLRSRRATFSGGGDQDQPATQGADH